MIFNPIFRFSSLLIQTEEKSESKQKKKEEGLKRRKKKKTEATDAVREAIDKRMDSRRKDREGSQVEGGDREAA
jgi:hypothetical protein